MRIVEYALRLMAEPVQLRIGCLRDGVIDTDEMMAFLAQNTQRMRQELSGKFDLPALQIAIVVASAELIVFAGSMRRLASINGQALEVVELQWVQGDAAKLAREFAANVEYIGNVLSETLVQYTTQDNERPAAPDQYARLDVDVVGPARAA